MVDAALANEQPVIGEQEQLRLDAVEAFMAAHPEHDVNAQSSIQIQGLLAERQVLKGLQQAMSTGMPRGEAVASLVNDLGAVFSRNAILEADTEQILDGGDGVSRFRAMFKNEVLASITKSVSDNLVAKLLTAVKEHGH